MNLYRKIALGVVAAGVILGGAGWAYWRLNNADALPAGLVVANGRVEATQIEIAVKTAGRVLEIIPQEGDRIEIGDVVARLDPAEIAAQLRESQAAAMKARAAVMTAKAALVSRNSERLLADQGLRRTAELASKGYATLEKLDQQKQQVSGGHAAVAAAEAQVAEAIAAVNAADAQTDQIKTLLDDATIRSPARGRVQYRLIEPGAVLAAGGRILTLIDLLDVSMTVFLPAADAGRLIIGDAARVVLDASPLSVFPATISFVAAEAQFTPKTVETKDEREKLMFRVKLQASREMLQSIEDRVKSGLRGVAYLRVDRAVEWPARLAVKLPD
jgi:HlyD family secretion protein